MTTITNHHHGESPRKNTSIPLSRPVLGRDEQMIDFIPVRAGTMVIAGTAAVNRDPAVWGPNADQWVPERWFRPLPEAVIDAYPPEASSHTIMSVDLRNLSSADERADLLHPKDGLHGRWASVHVR